MRWLYGITNAANTILGKPWEMVRDREEWHAAVHGVAKSEHNWATEQQQEKISLYCFARQRGPQWANALKMM